MCSACVKRGKPFVIPGNGRQGKEWWADKNMFAAEAFDKENSSFL